VKKAFRDSYNRELALLKERASEFAAEYPGLADRLGGLLEDNLDPAIAGLLEGSAFLAARVQLKIQEEFRGFTHELLDQVFPDALAPTPSVMLVRAAVPFDNSDIINGLHFRPGDYLDARYLDADKRVSCRFSLTAPLSVWPVEITGARYHASTGPIGALGQDIAPDTKAGLVVDLSRLGPSGKVDGAPLSELAIDDLVVHFSAPLSEASVLYEQIFCNRTRVSLRWLDRNGDAVFSRLAPDQIQQIGFDDDDRLFAHQEMVFDGFARLREYFAFQRKFLGLRLTGLAPYLSRLPGSDVQIIFEFDTASQVLAERLEARDLALNAAPAVNLFEEISSQVRVDRKHHEYIVTPNSAPVTHYELHHITSVWAFYPGHQQKVQVHPLYALPPGGQDPRQALYFTSRRKDRRLTADERRFGTSKYRYRGTETFLSLYEPERGAEGSGIQRLQVRALCSNRHLPEYLPIAQGTSDFHMTDDQTVALSCIAGPTPPRASLADLETNAAHRTQAGDVYWRLISYLSLSQFGLQGHGGQDAAPALREMLSLFADLSEPVAEAQVNGLIDVQTRLVVRTIAHPDGYHTARGLEVTLTFDESEYEGSGVIVLGAVLDRFLAAYASVNSFTQVVIASRQRHKIKTWPARTGTGPIL
tara:strand:- start:541 stop:2475 length:1935 start_codon:yes stop_codon:yes gene_type:complete